MIVADVFAGRVVRVERRGAIVRGAQGDILCREADMEVGRRVAYQVWSDSEGEHARIVDRTSAAFVGMNAALASGGRQAEAKAAVIRQSRWDGSE